jgi:hypothetical protein
MKVFQSTANHATIREKSMMIRHGSVGSEIAVARLVPFSNQSAIQENRQKSKGMCSSSFGPSWWVMDNNVARTRLAIRCE